MPNLNPTPPERMTDVQGRPYFLWDSDMTLDEFRRLVRHEDPEVRAYFLGKLMRQAKPDDVFCFVTLAEIRENWIGVQRYLGKSARFWHWLLETWEAQRHAAR